MRRIDALRGHLSAKSLEISTNGSKRSESRRGAAGRFPPESVLRAARQAEGGDRALAPLACHGHIAAHHARQLAGDGEAKTSAPKPLPGRGIGRAELLAHLNPPLPTHA